jgi:hypothetical protein
VEIQPSMVGFLKLGIRNSESRFVRDAKFKRNTVPGDTLANEMAIC